MINLTGDDENNDIDSENKALRLARLPRLYRLLRVLRLVRLIKTLKFLNNKRENISDSKLNKLSSSIKQIVKILFSILYLCNLVSCFWFF